MQVIERRMVVNSSVVSAELDEEAVLLNVETGVYYGLDAVGYRIWQLLEIGQDLDQIVQTLLDEYDVDANVLTKDANAFLDELSSKGLISFLES